MIDIRPAEAENVVTLISESCVRKNAAWGNFKKHQVKEIDF